MLKQIVSSLTTGVVGGVIGGFISGSYVAINGLVKITIVAEADKVQDANVERINITRDINDINKYDVHLVFNSAK